MATFTVSAPIKAAAKPVSIVDSVKLKYILKCIINGDRILQSSADLIQKLRIFSEDPDMSLIWDSVYQYWKSYSRKIHREALKLDLELRLAENLESGEEVDSVVLDAYISEWFSDVSFEDDRDAIGLLQEIIRERSSVQLKNKLIMHGTLEKSDVEEALDEMSPIASTVRVKNPFIGDPSQYLIAEERTAIGVPFIDSMLEGGVAPGDTIGFVMPSKGGKTTLVAQISNANMLLQRGVLTCSFEQPLEGDITERLYTLATNSTRSNWKGCRFDMLSEELKARKAAVDPIWADNFFFVDDWVRSDEPLTSVKDIFRVIDGIRREGKNVQFLLIDWWGRMKNKLFEQHPHIRNDSDKRRLQSQWLHDIKSLSTQYGVITIVFQQLAGAEASKSKGRVSSAFCAQEDSNFVNMFDACFVSSIPDMNTGTTIFDLAVCRMAAPNRKLVTLNGPRCRFEFKKVDDGDEILSQADMEYAVTSGEDYNNVLA